MPDWVWWIIAIIILILLLLLLLLFAKKRLEEMYEEMGGGDEGEDGGGGDGETQRAFRQMAKEAQVREILRSGNDDVIKMLLDRAGVGHDALKDRSHEAELVREIAERIGRVKLEVLNTAATQQDVQFDLQSTLERIPVEYPTSDMEPVLVEDYDQLKQVNPEDLIDDQFIERVAVGDVQVLQSYETETQRKLLYVLMDVSGSMDNVMSNGMKRHVWARGIGISLMVSAIKGEAAYLFRFFDGQPHQLYQVETRAQAQQLLNTIENSGLSAGGTDINRALNTAAKDIRANANGIKAGDILLISDGEDTFRTGQLKKILGDDIRLHVALIGSHSDELEAVATSYKEYN